MEESSLEAEFWHGPYCYKKSQMEGSHSFPMSEEGRQAEGLAGIPSLANKSAARQGEWFRPPVRQIDTLQRRL